MDRYRLRSVNAHDDEPDGSRGGRQRGSLPYRAFALSPRSQDRHRLRPAWRISQTQVETEYLIEITEKTGVQFANAWAEAVDRNRPDLFGLCFGVLPEAGDPSRQ